jgi:uncharacterized protein
VRRDFPCGTFDRSRLPRPLRGLCPVRAVDSVLEIDPVATAASGKRLLLLDVDHTLLPWRRDEIPESTLDWLRRVREAGLQALVISNTRHPERLDRLCERMGLARIQGRHKPNPDMYRRAMAQAGCEPTETLMIGDQLFTDVLGANRCGIDAIWVRQMEDRDFITTRCLRSLERVLHRRFAR